MYIKCKHELCLADASRKGGDGRSGYCHTHYRRLLHGRNIDLVPRWELSEKEKFYEKFIEISDCGCWIWTDSSFKGKGSNIEYGQFGFRGKRTPAHRASWMIHKGEIPVGMLVCHKCDTGLCVNPNHLFLGTYQENMDDMKLKMRQQYGDGHKMAKINSEIVIQIRKDKRTMSAMSKVYNVSRTTISNVIHRKIWKHVPEEAQT